MRRSIALWFIGLGLAMVLFSLLGYWHVNAQDIMVQDKNSTEARLIINNEFINTGDCFEAASLTTLVKIPCACGGVPKELKQLQSPTRECGGQLDCSHGSDNTSEYRPVVAVPFDVPPKEREVEITDAIYRHCREGESSTLGPEKCFDTYKRTEKIYECKPDKKRVLMSSEDGVRHCFALYLLDRK